jgi:cell division protein FtsQ
MTPPASSGPGRGRGPAAPRRRPAPPAAPKAKPAAPKAKPKPAAPKAKPKPAAPKAKPAAPKPKPKTQPKTQPAAAKPAAARRPQAPKKTVSASRSTGLLPQYAPARRRPVVSKTSAQRFAAKVRARRRKRTLTTLAVVVVMATGSWLALFSPWATVNRVTVSGLDRIPQDQVRLTTDPELGRSLLLAHPADLAAQLEKLRLVKSVRVSRSWPGALKVAVTEREPVAALPSSTMAANATAETGTARSTTLMMQLVDDDGVVIETVPAGDAPAALPRIEVALGQAQSVANLRGTLAVLDGLPANLRSRLKAIGTQSPDGIWLKLATPVKSAPKRTVLVQWGDSAQGALKAKVLTALLRQKAKTYDVRAPEMPSTS